MQKEQLIDKLDSKLPRKRLRALAALCKDTEFPAPAGADSLQFRSVYSGFAFTPSMCAYKSALYGSATVSLIDFATLKGANEFLKAVALTGGTGYIGVGVNSRVKGMRLALQAIGIPHMNVKSLHKKLAKARSLKAAHVNRLRELINAKTDNIKFYLPPDLLLLAKNRTASAENLYNALAAKIRDKFPTGGEVVDYLTNGLGFELDESSRDRLADETNPLYLHDLAATLRAYLGVKDIPETTIQAKDFVAYCDEAGAISAAIYNGAPLDEFLAACKKLGVKAVCVEPDRNNGFTPEEFYDAAFGQGFLPLSRKVIDRPRKKAGEPFGREETAGKYLESALAVCGHEISASISPSDGLFSEKTVAAVPDLAARIKLFSKIPQSGLN